jgi:oligoribonuclease
MKYVSIDIETTGLDSEKHQILTIGAVIEDSNKPLPIEDLPSIHIAILRKEIVGIPFAINMNKDIIESLVYYQTARDQNEKNDLVQMKGMKFCEEDDVVEMLFHFLYDNGIKPDWGGGNEPLDIHVKVVGGNTYPILTSNIPKVTFNAAGKNFASFDLKFLERLPRWKQVFRVRSRILDPGILFTDWERDFSVPGLSECKKRAGLNHIVTHDAIDDARDVIELLRNFYK